MKNLADQIHNDRELILNLKKLTLQEQNLLFKELGNRLFRLIDNYSELLAVTKEPLDLQRNLFNNLESVLDLMRIVNTPRLLIDLYAFDIAHPEMVDMIKQKIVSILKGFPTLSQLRLNYLGSDNFDEFLTSFISYLGKWILKLGERGRINECSTFLTREVLAHIYNNYDFYLVWEHINLKTTFEILRFNWQHPKFNESVHPYPDYHKVIAANELARSIAVYRLINNIYQNPLTSFSYKLPKLMPIIKHGDQFAFKQCIDQIKSVKKKRAFLIEYINQKRNFSNFLFEINISTVPFYIIDYDVNNTVLKVLIDKCISYCTSNAHIQALLKTASQGLFLSDFITELNNKNYDIDSLLKLLAETISDSDTYNFAKILSQLNAKQQALLFKFMGHHLLEHVGGFQYDRLRNELKDLDAYEYCFITNIQDEKDVFRAFTLLGPPTILSFEVKYPHESEKVKDNIACILKDFYKLKFYINPDSVDHYNALLFIRFLGPRLLRLGSRNNILCIIDPGEIRDFY